MTPNTITVTLLGFVILVLLAIIRARGRANKRLAEKNDKLGAALHVSERKLSESETARKQAELKINEVKAQIASLIREATSNKPLCETSQKRTLALPPNGGEVFLPALDPDRVYQITIQGTCKFRESTGLFSRREAYADALYRTNKVGNFLESHDCLQLGQVPIGRFLKGVPRETVPEEDREAHRYSFRIDGAARKTSVSFHVAFDHIWDGPSGRLELTVELLPEGTPSPAAGERREEAARESAKLAEQSAKENSALVAKLESLRRRTHHESHFLDPEFQQQYARQNAKDISAHLKKDWAREYDEVLHGPLKRLAEEQAPEVTQWLEAKAKIARLAERLIVTPLPASEPIEVMTAEEIRAAKLQKHADEHNDRIALARLKGEKAAEADAVLESLPIDDDLKERLKTELTDSIFESEAEQEGGNNVTL